jgi:hypothetical protein
MTAEMVMQKLKSIGYQIRTDGQDILLSADHDPDPELATILLSDLKQCKAEAVRLLQMGTNATSNDMVRSGSRRSAAWPPDVKSLIDWFLISTTPEAPFHLNSCTRVINSEVFYAALRREIEAGPRGTRARYGALQSDLRDLAKLQ